MPVVLLNWYRVLFLLVLFVITIQFIRFGIHDVYAQSAQEVVSQIDEPDPLLIARVRIRGNEVFTKDQIQARIRTRANRRFLRIPGFNWWLWLYNLGDSGFLGGRLGNALKSTGEPPAYLDYLILDQDVERLKVMYQQAGYRNARVDTEVDTTSRRKIEVVFSINQGEPTHVRNVTYETTSLIPLNT